MRLGPVDVLRLLPQTNCGDCGHQTCLAFATAVVRFSEDMRACPHIDEAGAVEMEKLLEAHRSRPAYSLKEKEDIALDYLKDKIKDRDFKSSARGLGAEYREDNGRESLALPYFDRKILLTRERAEPLDGGSLDRWDEVLVYNYVFFSGKAQPTGRWVGLESFPNSISKRATLTKVFDEKISLAFSGRLARLQRASRSLGGVPEGKRHTADLAVIFDALPRVPLLMLFWDEDPGEGFEARARVLFDDTAPEYLDLESLVFLAEKLALRLNAKDKEVLDG